MYPISYILRKLVKVDYSLIGMGIGQAGLQGPTGAYSLAYDKPGQTRLFS